MGVGVVKYKTIIHIDLLHKQCLRNAYINAYLILSWKDTVVTIWHRQSECVYDKTFRWHDLLIYGFQLIYRIV